MAPPIFHFQFMGERGWESIGAGDGETGDPLGGALDEVRELSGGKLPPGVYQVIESRSSDTRWQSFELSEDGEIVD